MKCHFILGIFYLLALVLNSGCVSPKEEELEILAPIGAAAENPSGTHTNKQGSVIEDGVNK